MPVTIIGIAIEEHEGEHDQTTSNEGVQAQQKKQQKEKYVIMFTSPITGKK
jgi:hypothetical protein